MDLRLGGPFRRSSLFSADHFKFGLLSMIVVIGCAVVFGAVLVGFMISGGHVGALLHPAELLTIGGASIGALIMMSPKKVLVDLMHGIVAALRGSPYNRLMYGELFAVSYHLLKVGRRDGLLALDQHVNYPKESSIFERYPRFAANHHAVEFLCGGLSLIVENSVTSEQLSELLEAELKVIEEEHHAPVTVLSKTADALPGFGIVAAVLGIVITMGAINGPVEEVGHKVGSALVGTFLGIQLSYAFFGPLAARMEFVGAAELAFFRTIASIVRTFANERPPKVVIEQARRGVGTEVRPNRSEINAMFAKLEAA
jgi:chemotaxis protein MotA